MQSHAVLRSLDTLEKSEGDGRSRPCLLVMLVAPLLVHFKLLTSRGQHRLDLLPRWAGRHRQEGTSRQYGILFECNPGKRPGIVFEVRRLFVLYSSMLFVSFYSPALFAQDSPPIVGRHD